jgi:hypothetical protein
MLVLIASTGSFSTTLKHGEPKRTQRFSVIYGAWGVLNYLENVSTTLKHGKPGILSRTRAQGEAWSAGPGGGKDKGWQRYAQRSGYKSEQPGAVGVFAQQHPYRHGPKYTYQNAPYPLRLGV